MIYSLTGKISVIEQNLAVVECGGVGYACRATVNTLATLKVDSEARLYTYMAVREDAVELFGFADLQELNCFKMLISVSGVGPKAAISILSGMTPQAFALCVASGDSKSLMSAPGIGKKIADRIVLELKDKIAKENLSVKSDALIPVATSSNSVSEAISALMVLGYSNTEATKAIAGMPADTPTDALIKAGLKNLAKF
ncbi:MAG: Holliday junction branch migration protein RuvA [Ruminococcaceae bacterium]|nr:Holliday junction branch migration protein RuvA [Oscillospiraceae bacterium]